MNSIHLNKDLTDLPGEIWKPIPIEGHEETFLVSNLGRLKKLSFIKAKNRIDFIPKVQILSQDISDRGYCRADLCTGGKSKLSVKVHRMVALAFISNDNPA